MSEKRKKNKRLRLSSGESDSSSMSSSMSSSSSSSDDEVDSKDLKPIKEYLSNRKELASQLFKSVKTDKIKLMLPQILKKVDLTDLEELCATELTGMSKKRIICILNGQELVQSSDTDDTDDSGPSLEIISDTEWISDDNTNVKVEGAKNNKGSKKSKKKPLVKKEQDQKPKRKGKDGKANVKVKLEKVKTEGKEKSKDKEKDKEGESLLDLLELEMRARAIRALIRKEEDSSDPNAKNGKANDSAIAASGSGTSNDNSKARQADLKEQLEKIDVLMKHGEDEDVYVVINPAPTIELLSSESENEKENKNKSEKENKNKNEKENKNKIEKENKNKNDAENKNKIEKENKNKNDAENETSSKRINQKFASERKSLSETIQEKESINKDKPSTSKEIEKEIVIKNKPSVNKEKDVNNDKDVRKEKNKDKEGSKTQEKDKNEKTKVTSNEKQSSNLPISVIENDEKDKPESLNVPPKPQELEDGEIVDDEEDKAVSKKENKTVEDSTSKKIKKIKKNPHIRLRNKSKDREGNNKKESAKASTSEINKPVSDADKIISKMTKPAAVIEESIEIEDSPERTENTNKILERRCSKDDDIFDEKALDIEEIINLDDYPDDIEDVESKKEVSNSKSESKEADKSTADSDTHHSETWASRYYQQDDVKNVIKESKIQSEIRKRLRERQKQIKMNSSPKESETTTPEPVVVPKAIGSVEEYLALKGTSTDTSSDVPEDKIDSAESSKKDDSPLADTKGNDDSCSSEKTLDSNLPQITQVEVIAKPIIIKRKPQLIENVVSTSKIENLTVERLSKVLKCNNEILDKPVQESKEIKEVVDKGEEITDEKKIVSSIKVDEKDIVSPVDADEKEISTPVQTDKKMIASSVKIDETEIALPVNIDIKEIVSPTKINVEKIALPVKSYEKKISSPTKTEETTLNTSLNTSFNTSDSSDDNIIVKIDNSFWTNKLNETSKSTQQAQQSEQTVLSDSNISELRPD